MTPQTVTAQTTQEVRERLGVLMTEALALFDRCKKLDTEQAWALAVVLTDVAVRLQDLLREDRLHQELLLQTLQAILPMLKRLRELGELELFRDA